MSYSDSRNSGPDSGPWRNDGGVPPHAYDPYLEPELFRGVSTRRVFAFLIDLIVISIPVILGYIFIAVFGHLLPDSVPAIANDRLRTTAGSTWYSPAILSLLST